ncbi:MAG: prephenate dehydrogenase/arogenate dehydrogenase family protein [Candidatus Thermoplasmatota archaeon]|nr:prephenate dehydrogenase/arogenate dehydrogenase family protein [Candidatus Thermoplasmatota archaeon]
MKIAIIGIGKMGSWLSNKLQDDNEVAVYDTDKLKTSSLKGVTVLSSLPEIAVFQPEVLINAVNLGSTIEVFDEISQFLNESCMIADIASIKGDLSSYYIHSRHKFVSTHPMFGPTNANMSLPVGESAIIIKESEESGKKIFRDFYQKIGLNVYELSFIEHDSMMAYSLTLPFSSSMVFAACVDTRAVPGTNFKRHMELARGLLSEDDSLLSEILFNPRSISQLEKITSRLEFLKHIIRDRDYQEAGRFFDKLRENIGK